MDNNKRIVFVGPSCGGKHTLVDKLCQPVYDPTVPAPRIFHQPSVGQCTVSGPHDSKLTIIPGTLSGRQTHDKVIEIAPFACVIVVPHGQWDLSMEQWLNEFLATPVCNRTILAMTQSESLINDDGDRWVSELKQVCEPLNMIGNDAIVFTGAITESDINVGGRLNRLQQTCQQGMEQLRNKLF